MWKKYIQRIILIMIAILGIKTSAESFLSNIKTSSNDTAYLEKWDGWISKLIAPIPFEHGFVGYISNEDISGTIFDEANIEGEFVLTQYAVAPLILVRGTEQEWDIINLDPDIYKKWIQANANDFEFIKSAGGMYLVHKVRK